MIVEQSELEKQMQQEIDENKQCRDILNEIMNFGISQKGILKLIRMLALELENRDAMVKLSELSKEYIGNYDFQVQFNCSLEDSEKESDGNNG